MNNKSIKYEDNIEEPENLLLDYSSKEIEEKFDLNRITLKMHGVLIGGAGYQRAHYTNDTFNNKTQINGEVTTIDFSSRLNFNKYALFGSISRKFFDERLNVSFGITNRF